MHGHRYTLDLGFLYWASAHTYFLQVLPRSSGVMVASEDLWLFDIEGLVLCDSFLLISLFWMNVMLNVMFICFMDNGKCVFFR